MKDMKKNLCALLVTLIVALLITGCGTEKVENKVLTLTPVIEEKNGENQNTYTGTYTGELKSDKPHGNGVFKARDKENRAVTFTGGFKKGKLDGVAIIETEDQLLGVTKTECTYNEGKKNGMEKIYFFGKLFLEAEHKDGDFTGKMKGYHKNGKVAFEFECDNIEKLKKDAKNGLLTLSNNNDIMNGRAKEYYESGQLKFDGKYQAGKPSEGTLYNQDGSVQYKGKFINGKPAR